MHGSDEDDDESSFPKWNTIQYTVLVASAKCSVAKAFKSTIFSQFTHACMNESTVKGT